MLQPKKEKFIKNFRGRRRGTALRGSSVSFGDFGLKSLEVSWITAAQIEAARKAISHHLKRGGKVWIRIFPDKPITKRPPEVTMGGGKGSVDHYVVPIRPGRILFEMEGVPADVAKEALRLAGFKLPVKTKVVSK